MKQLIDGLRRRHRIAIERDHVELVAGQRDGAVLDRARVQQMQQHALAVSARGSVRRRRAPCR